MKRKGYQTQQSHQWLSSVEMSGLLLSEPVLQTEFPNGPPPIDPYVFKRFRNEFERFMLSPRETRQKNSRQWINFILEDFLEIPSHNWKKSDNLPDTTCVELDQFCQTLKPSRIIQQNGKINFIASIIEVDQNLDKADRTPGRWKASPSTKLDRILRETETRIGLLTNGFEWRLMYSEPGLNTTHMTWTSQVWNDERATLNAFRMILNRGRFFDDSGKRLLIELIKDSQEKQIEIADQLGIQIREAIEIFVHEIDRLDRSLNGELLKDFSNEELYEIAIVVMMRIVFLLFAEENGLLPHGEVLYDHAYGVNHLAFTLQQTFMANPDLLSRQIDAWQSLLATFRLIHDGCEFSELNLRAYGGSLFDPKRFCPKGNTKSILEDPRFLIPNKAIHEILHKLTYARAKIGKEIINQRVSYNTLDVEQIGYMYEGLLDHTILKADDLTLKLKAKDDVKLPIRELFEKRESDFENWLKKRTDRSIPAIKKALEEPPNIETSQKLKDLAGEKYYEQLLPYANLIDLNFIAFPGECYVGLGATRRATGSHYTPQVLTEPIVRNTLAPLAYENPDTKSGLKSPKEILDLKVADIAMGSGAFLVQAVRYLSERLVDSWDNFEVQHPDVPITPYGAPSKAQDEENILPIEREERLLLAKRLIVDNCIYGVDVNPLAVEMAKLSLWLVTFSKDKPFTFLKHALKEGDSLLGVNLEQLQHWSLTESREMAFSSERVMKDLDRVIELRKELKQIVVNEVEDAEYKAKILQESELLLEWLKAAGDLVIAPALESTDSKRQKSLTASNRDAFIGYLDEQKDIQSLRKTAKSQLNNYKPFHWHIEFPEVFLRINGGFDAIIGNPPFKGGQHITGLFGVPYRDYLVDILASGKKGSADLCAYFFLRSFGLISEGGKLGLLATNTIAQGDTREVGLEQIMFSKGEIYQAVPTMVWPGIAAVHVAKVNISKGMHPFQKVIDEKDVKYISAFLDSIKILEKPYPLKANKNKSFQGSIVLGLGFVLDPNEYEALVDKNPKNKEVLYPYLIGNDLNSRPDQSPSRWIINFKDWPLDRTTEGSWENSPAKERNIYLEKGIVPRDYPGPVAADYPDCLKILEEKVKPERIQYKPINAWNKSVKKYWWLFGAWRKNLTESIVDMERVLVHTRVTRIHSFCFLPIDYVFGDSLVVFPFASFEVFAILQSDLHNYWAWYYSSSLKGDRRYSPTDCFETFPFPELNKSLEFVGKSYYGYRESIMLSQQKGLTQTYNRFHNPDEKSVDVQKRRDLQVELDNAVLFAYGWNDLQLEHDFYVVSSMLNKDGKRVEEIRFTISPEAKEEVLERLLKLNHQRYEEEVKRGLHDKKGKKKYKKSATKKFQVKEEQQDLFK